MLAMHKSSSENSVRDPSFFQLSWPLLVESTLYLLVGVVDAAILARVSAQAAAAVGACTFVITFLVTIVMGFGQGACISISHRLGSNKHKEAAAVAMASSAINIVIGLLLGLIVHLLRYNIPVWLGLTSEARHDAMTFLSIVGGTTVLWSLLISTSYILKSYGHTKYNMYTALLVNIVNASLAWIAVEGYFGLPKMGVEAVAWCTFIARMAGIIFSCHLLFKVVKFDFQPFVIWKQTKQHHKEIFHYGIPVSLEPLAYQGSQLFITMIVAQLGTAALTTRTFVWSIISLNKVAVMAFAQATQILVGRFYGSKKFEEAEREFNKNFLLSILSSLVMVTIIYLSGEQIMHLFTKDEKLIHTAVTLFAVGYLMEPGRTSNVITGSALRAVGDPKFPLYIGLIFMWGVSVPVAWFLGIYLELGLLGVWYGLALDELLRGILNYARFRQKKWMQDAVNHP